jgi:cytochrome c553
LHLSIDRILRALSTRPSHAKRLLELTLPALLLALSSGAFSAESDPVAGQRKTITCNGCHAQAGMKNVPSLGGQNAAYIFVAMQAYQDGLRSHATMRDVAKSYSTQELRNFAAYYAQPAPAPAQEALSAPPAAAERCASCHGGPAAATLRADIPRLAGQKAAYLELALKDYRSGARKHIVMQQQALSLTEAEIDEVAVYYAAQPGLFVK